MKQPSAQQKRQFAAVLKKSQQDKAFRKRLLAHPEETLKKEGIDLPPGVHLKFLEQIKNTHYMVLPNEYEELSEAELMRMVGGQALVGGGWWQGSSDDKHNS